ncbi:MAG: NADH-quinone oxidoreductase subunit J [Campylobacteraceae bacterium]|jgi:NADH-quinone oxidoreductase subunit J|nr:NADH-quinone oxidoreductase subunit J [Campylobacteraceae bacterium]
MYEAIAFYLLSALVIGFFLITVLSKNALYAMSSLAGGMVFIGGFFFLLDAEFIGVVQIIVYTGSIMALYAFGMMFFDTTRDVRENTASKRIIYTMSILSAVLITAILSAPLASEHITPTSPVNEDMSNTHMIGQVLFTEYLAVFELTALMLLVAMIAGIILVSKRMDEVKEIVKEAK